MQLLLLLLVIILYIYIDIDIGIMRNKSFGLQPNVHFRFTPHEYFEKSYINTQHHINYIYYYTTYLIKVVNLF